MKTVSITITESQYAAIQKMPKSFNLSEHIRNYLEETLFK